jgi:ribosomal protein S27AE
VALLVILFFFGLSAGVIGKIKGSSFLLWFLIGFFLPFIGTLAAVLYRFEGREPRQRCPECGRVLALHDQVCIRCGRDLDFPGGRALREG